MRLAEQCQPPLDVVQRLGERGRRFRTLRCLCMERCQLHARLLRRAARGRAVEVLDDREQHRTPPVGRRDVEQRASDRVVTIDATFGLARDPALDHLAYAIVVRLHESRVAARLEANELTPRERLRSEEGVDVRQREGAREDRHFDRAAGQAHRFEHVAFARGERVDARIEGRGQRQRPLADVAARNQTSELFQEQRVTIRLRRELDSACIVE